MPPHTDPEVAHLLKENTTLVAENNRLLKKLYRNGMIELWLRLLWYAIIIGLPFALYFYILEPYFEVFGGSFSDFQKGMEELPGLKVLQWISEGKLEGE